ncbi:MAG: hypothetical protein ACI841_001299 [Planctomycetota bacterium]|jgi:hypothetical protein
MSRIHSPNLDLLMSRLTSLAPPASSRMMFVSPRSTLSRFALQPFMAACLCAAGLSVLTACGSDTPVTPPAAQEQQQEHAHVHVAPRGGLLIAVEAEYANIEFLVDPTTGELVAYLLDGHAQNAVRVAREEIQVSFEPAAGGDSFEVTLKAVNNPLSGDKPGACSEFRGSHGSLSKAGDWKLLIHEVELRGRTYRDVAFELQTEG